MRTLKKKELEIIAGGLIPLLAWPIIAPLIAGAVVGTAVAASSEKSDADE